MSFEMRNNTAMSKRAEQLKRWEESDTNREPDYPKNEAGRRIKFSSGCVFLAACLSGDKEEVLRLLDAGADIDTANVDGLTALHQACIDDNLEMVEFLVQAGADVNRQDNEGWTPLHATSSCGFLSIARFLIESGANLAAVSSDGELVVDLAESDRMEALLQRHIEEQGIDCDEARQSEERLMLSDAKNWLRSDASEADKPHPRTGATALHVAAAKGYSKVLSLLLATRADVDKQDNDGWTPLHAAAHWGQKEAAQMLVASLADMDVKNYAGQTVFEVADPSALRFLEDLKKNNKRSKRRPASQIRISDGMDNHIETTPSKVIRVEVMSNESKDGDGPQIEFLENVSDEYEESEGEHETDGDEAGGSDSTESSHSTSVSDDGDVTALTKDTRIAEVVFEDDVAEEPPKDMETGLSANGSADMAEFAKDSPISSIVSTDKSDELASGDDAVVALGICVAVPECGEDKPKPPSEPAASLHNKDNTNEEDTPWRRSGSLRSRQQQESPPKNQLPQPPPDKEPPQPPQTQPPPLQSQHLPPPTTGDTDVILRRTQSFENDEKFYQKYQELRARIKANSCPVLPATPVTGHIGGHGVVGGAGKGTVPPVQHYTATGLGVIGSNSSYLVQRSASLKDHRQLRKTVLSPIVGSPTTMPPPPTTPTVAKTTLPSGQVRRSAAEELVRSQFSAFKNMPSPVIQLERRSQNRLGGSTASLNKLPDPMSTSLTLNSRNASSISDLESAASETKRHVEPPKPASVPATKPAPPPVETEATIRANKFTPSNIFKSFFKSFVPPSRDEESETQRKAHAKRVRETRRSTQGVTLDEIKSAEELIKKKNANNNNNTSDADASATTTQTVPNDRVPSIRQSTDDDLLLPPAPPTSCASSLDPSPVQITASYTISAPPTPTNRTSILPKLGDLRPGDNDDSANAVSATFTMPSPTSPQPPSRFGAPTSPTKSPEDKPVEVTKPTSIALDPEVVIIPKLRSPRTSPATSPLKPTTPDRTSIRSSVIASSNNDDPSTTEAKSSATTTLASPTADFTFSKILPTPKRSLFDQDNASSLSLADKLRNEANKYSTENKDDDDILSSAVGTVVPVSTRNSDAIRTTPEKSTADPPSSPPPTSGGGATAERRPSWRLKFDAGSKFKLEDVVVTLAAPGAVFSTTTTSSTIVTPATTGSGVPITAQRRGYEPTARPISAPVIGSVDHQQPPPASHTTTITNNDRVKDATNINEVVTLPLRRSKVTDEDKENDKENDSRSAQATQAVIQRRRRPKRRSTGVVHVDMDDIDPDRQEGTDGADEKESGSERTSRSRLGSTSSLVSDANDLKSESTENGDLIDYKALYEAARLDNDKLKVQLKKKDEDLFAAKATVDRFANATTKNSLSELEKRERRAMERKLSEMEEELKHLEALKTENQRLKDENGALIRVISKLSK